ncbi:MAG TPA: EXLDI protein, partial [Candidatus Limnocylindrales bacterium]
AGRYDEVVPNKTIYVSDGDLSLFQRAQEFAGGNLSAAISAALKRYVDVEESRKVGYDEIILRVGIGAGRKVRFMGVLLGEWMDATPNTVHHYRVYRTQKDKFVLYHEHGAEYSMVDAEGKPAGWRGYLGIGNIKYGSTPAEKTLDVFDTIDELREATPPELFEMVQRSAKQPLVEDLDI